MSEPGSLSHRVAERQRQRAARRAEPIIVPVPGYQDLLAVRYGRLSMQETAKIGEKHDPATDGIAGPVALLVKACDQILEVTGTDDDGNLTYGETGEVWSVGGIGRLFERNFPEGTTTRAAMCEVLDEHEIARHFTAYTNQVQDLDRRDLEELPGESETSASL